MQCRPLVAISAKSTMEFKISGLPEMSIGNEGLRKRVLKKGNSLQTPFPGDEVEVHYNVWMKDGEYFDSSYTKGTPFRFKLGQCEVIKGLDEGIATMKKGERAMFIVPPHLGYGEVGSPLMIPPDSTLVFEIEMLCWYSVRKLTGNGGIVKKIIREGEGWATPKDADEVLVKYVATDEDGTVVSKSNEGTEFCVANGYLCPAMSRAVKTMRKGERAEFSVKFNDDDHCASDMFTTNLKLTIHMELLSWKRIIDVMGDKKIVKKITKIGEGFDHPNEGSLAKVIYVGRHEDGTVFESKGSKEKPFAYVCLGDQINEGLDQAIMTMKKGEQATVSVSSEFFHGTEIGKWLSAASVHYEVELINFDKEKPFWKMDTEEKLEACRRKKSDGNAFFKSARFQLASNKYEKAAKYLEFDHSFNNDEKFLGRSLKLACHLNNAACKLNLGKYLEASRICTKVLELDAYSVKALYRRAQAYLMMAALENAEVDIKRALAIDPSNREVRVMHKKLKDLQRQYIQHEAEFYSGLLSRSAHKQLSI